MTSKIKLASWTICMLLGCGNSSDAPTMDAEDSDGGASNGATVDGDNGGSADDTDSDGGASEGEDSGNTNSSPDGGAPTTSNDPPALTDFVGATAQDPCVQATHFLTRLKPDPANAAFADPFLDVGCSATEVTVMSNNIPSFAFVQKTPNALVEMDMTYRFPRFPKLAAATTAVPLGGTVAVAVNGLSIFGPTEAPMMGYRDPYIDGLLDFCNGHTAPGGMYHFHARPDCLFKDAEGNVRLVVAYAFDGFPILAPYACSSSGDCAKTRALESSWQRVASKWKGDTPDYTGTSEGSWDIHEYVKGSGDLDECNGLDLPGGGYAYYATDTFPYFVGCFRGTPTTNRGH